MIVTQALETCERPTPLKRRQIGKQRGSLHSSGHCAPVHMRKARTFPTFRIATLLPRVAQRKWCRWKQPEIGERRAQAKMDVSFTGSFGNSKLLCRFGPNRAIAGTNTLWTMLALGGCGGSAYVNRSTHACFVGRACILRPRYAGRCMHGVVLA